MTTTVASLPAFPPLKTLRSLPPSQQGSLLDRVSSTLQQVINLPDDKLNSSHTSLLASYARDGAFEALTSLVFEGGSSQQSKNTLSQSERIIRQRMLVLARRLVSTSNAGGVELQILLDLSILYGPRNRNKIRDIFRRALTSRPELANDLGSQGVSAFSDLLQSAETGLNGLRKTIHCLSCLLHCAPPEVLKFFALDKFFMLALAKSYDARFSAIAASYGGIRLQNAELDETSWERLWIESKVELLDCFHILLQHVLHEVTQPSQNTNGAGAGRRVIEYAFDLLFALLEIPSSSGPRSGESTAFLNRSLLADYQQSYSLSSALASSLSNSDDARLDLLDNTLKAFDTEIDSVPEKKTGALKLLIRSSGIPPGVDHRGVSKGKAKDLPPPENIQTYVDDLAISQVLDIFPDQPPDYIRSLLSLPRFSGDAEQVIAALLEGHAPSPDELLQTTTSNISKQPGDEEFVYTQNRSNIFNDEKMDLQNVTIGKKREDADTVIQDRLFVQQMKSDILLRAEAMALESSDEEGNPSGVRREYNDEDEDFFGEDGFRETKVPPVKGVATTRRDGEESGEDEETDEEERTPAKPSPEMILELAYIRDPKLFDRDAATRRSKARLDLKRQTGWGDEQIEGWKIMLERNPKKDKILQKHDFSGNQPSILRADWNKESTGDSSSGGRGRGQGGRGRGRGRGGRGGGAGAGASGAGEGSGGPGSSNQDRDRAWKDKNKASRGNHNRKRGHDKKMARGGLGAPM